MNVNREQRLTSAKFYTNAIQDGNIASNAMTATNIGNDAALGWALFMVGNATCEHGTLWALRSFVNDVRHPVGLTFTEYGDMNVHGRSTSADQQHTNNRMEGRPHVELCNLTSSDVGVMMLEEEMISVAVAQSLQVPTPYMLAPGMMP